MAVNFLVTDEDQDRILVHLRSTGTTQTVQGIAEGAGLSRKDALLALCGLVPAGQVEQIGSSFRSRLSRCFQCGGEVPSSDRLPHFQPREGRTDSHYCGCRGWD